MTSTRTRPAALRRLAGAAACAGVLCALSAAAQAEPCGGREGARLASGAIAQATPAEPGADGPELLRLEGRVAEGPECPTLRTPDGRIFSLVGKDIRFTPGAYVEIEGRPVAMSFCMRGTTIEVRSLREIPPPTGE